MKRGFVYILTNKTNRVLYIGVTSELDKRIFQHKNKMIEGFTKRYNVEKLVYYEAFDSIVGAIEREKEIKGWIRQKKARLIASLNPTWKDLYNDIVG